MSMQAWNGWYHVTGSTYGTWLPGDPRGWRSRWRRERVDGDYKDPPPKDKFKALHERAKRRLTHPRVRFDMHQRRIAGQALVAKLSELGREVLVASMDSVHFHILGRFADGQVRRPVGQAKKDASHILSDHGLRGTVWARKCRPLPITDRSHQVNVFGYVQDHAEKDAWVWTYREGLYWIGQEDGERA